MCQQGQHHIQLCRVGIYYSREGRVQALRSVVQEVHTGFPLINGPYSLTATSILHSENIIYISHYFGLPLTVRKV